MDGSDTDVDDSDHEELITNWSSVKMFYQAPCLVDQAAGDAVGRAGSGGDGEGGRKRKRGPEVLRRNTRVRVEEEVVRARRLSPGVVKRKQEVRGRMIVRGSWARGAGGGGGVGSGIAGGAVPELELVGAGDEVVGVPEAEPGVVCGADVAGSEVVGGGEIAGGEVGVGKHPGASPTKGSRSPKGRRGVVKGGRVGKPVTVSSGRRSVPGGCPTRGGGRHVDALRGYVKLVGELRGWGADVVVRGAGVLAGVCFPAFHCFELNKY